MSVAYCSCVGWYSFAGAFDWHEEEDMHDLDRTQLETGFESYGYEVPELGSQMESGSVLESVFGEASEGSFENFENLESYESPLPEVMETQLAAELLEITNEQELDHFLGDLVRKATGFVGKALNLPTGASLGGILKSLGKKVLPIAGKALGGFIGGPAGAMLGDKAASLAGGLLGLEYGEMSPEDRDFDTARRFVRLSAEAAQQAAATPPQANPVVAAQAAVMSAAQKYAPGLLSATPVAPSGGFSPSPGSLPGHPGGCGCGSHRKRRGTWFRRGHHIILVGV
jgi:hypothetical protein